MSLALIGGGAAIGGPVGGEIGTTVAQLVNVFNGPPKSTLPQDSKYVQQQVGAILTDLMNLNIATTKTGQTFAQLRCEAGDQTFLPPASVGNVGGLYVLTPGKPGKPPTCGFQQQPSRDYAAAAVVSLANQAAASGVSVPASFTFQNVGGGTTTQRVVPAIAATVSGVPVSGQTITSVGSGTMPGWLLPVGAGLLAYLVLTGKRK